MEKTYQNIYKNFACVSSACKDSCCKKWEVAVDEKTICLYSRTEKLSEITENLSRSDSGMIFKNTNGNCPFLNKDELCRIILKAGEEYIPETCRFYPRFMRSFGMRREYGLTLSCPEVTRMFLENDFKLITQSDSEEPDITDIDAESYFRLSAERNARLKSPEIKIINHDMSFFNELEYLTSFIPDILNKTDGKTLRHAPDEVLLKIYRYYTYKYFMDALGNENYTRFAGFNTAAVKYLIEISQKPIADIIQRYSRETEHSALNIGTILSHCKK